MKDTSGHTSKTPFAYYDHDSHCLKTSQGTLLWDLIPSSLTLPPSGSMRDGQLYEHLTLGRRTTGNGFSYLPTPVASDHKRNNSPADQRRKSPGITTVTTYWPGLVEPPISSVRSGSGGETRPVA